MATSTIVSNVSLSISSIFQEFVIIMYRNSVFATNLLFNSYVFANRDVLDLKYFKLLILISRSNNLSLITQRFTSPGGARKFEFVVKTHFRCQFD